MAKHPDPASPDREEGHEPCSHIRNPPTGIAGACRKTSAPTSIPPVIGAHVSNRVNPGRPNGPAPARPTSRATPFALPALAHMF